VQRFSKTALPVATYLAFYSAGSAAADFQDGPQPQFIQDGLQTQLIQTQRLDATPGTGALANVTGPESATSHSQDLSQLPQETPCFAINKVDVRNNPWQWVDREVAPVQGQCVGAQGVKQVQQTVANSLIDAGYITTRVAVPEQSLSSGTLTLDVAPGRVASIRTQEDDNEAIGNLSAALPTYSGNIFDQRDIDQALENLRRLPSQADARFDIVPGAQPGESDLVMVPGSGNRWQGSIGYDNAGVDATGKNELSASVAVDSPLGLYDRLQVAGLTTAIDHASANKANNQASLSYSVPFGYAMLSVDASGANYRQSTATNYAVYRFTGSQKNAGIKLSGVVQRNARSRTELRARLFRAINDNFVNETTYDVQNRDVYGYELGVSHRRFIGNTQIDINAGWRETLPGISKVPGFATDAPNFNGHEQIVTTSASVLAPFRIGKQPFSYRFAAATQNALTPITSPDFFTIGSRYSVRGFDQQSVLAAENGWTVSNELDWYAPTSFGVQALYVGIDAGHVRGASTRDLPGTSLVGMAVGVRGNLQFRNRLGTDFTYDVSLGQPLYKPKAFPNKSPTVLMQVSALF
jgi:hemolysin activation/secretion protein